MVVAKLLPQGYYSVDEDEMQPEKFIYITINWWNLLSSLAFTILLIIGLM